MAVHDGRCFTASKDGSVREWDLGSRTRLDLVEVGAPVLRLQVTDASLYLVTGDKTGAHNVVRYDRRQRTLESLARLQKPVMGFALRPDGRTVAATSGRTLLVWMEDGALLRRKHTHDLGPVTFHPFDDYVCTGDVTGRIVLWYGYQVQVGGRPKPCVKSVLHWHAHAFQALQFTDDGTYLLSGGQERVLVQWQMHDGHRQFLPRLGGRVSSVTVSPRGDLYAVVCDDNAIRVVSAISSRIVAVVHGVLLPSIPDRTKSGKMPQRKVPVSYRIAPDRLNPGRGHVALSVSLCTRIQFFDTAADRSIALLETDPGSVNRGCLSEIGSWAQSFDGGWMAVALSSPKVLQANALSFYQWDMYKHAYVPRVRVDDHHRTHCVVFHPNRDVCVSLGPAQFRVWAPSDSKVRKAGTTWSVRHSGQFRDLRPVTAAFSHDGTLMAVAFQGSAITLWDMATTVLVHTFFDVRDVRHLAFCHRHLICASSDRLYSWDCVEAHFAWSSPVPAIVSLSCSTDFAAVATSTGTVSIFRPHQRNAALSKSLPLVNAVTFVDDHVLVAATSSGSLHRLPFV